MDYFRQFFSIARLLKTLVIFLPLAGFISCSSPHQEKEVGLQLWSVREAMNEDPQGTLAQIGEMGYSFIETAGYSNGLFYGMEPGEFKELAGSHGLDFLSSHVTKFSGENETPEELELWWEECIDAHKRAGVEYIVMASLPGSAYNDLEVLDWYIGYLNETGEKCRAEGISFGFHNHAQEFNTINGYVIYDRMLEKTNPEFVFFQPDIYWFEQGGADPLEYFEKYPGRFEVWHAKDYAELGESGKIDFERIFNQDTKSGRKHVIVEVEQYNHDPLTSVRISLEYLLNAEFFD